MVSEQKEITYEQQAEGEKYAHSLTTFRRLGQVALEGQADLEVHAALETLAFDDFTTAVAEMLKTDSEFRTKLDINNRREHGVIAGKVCAADGTPMVEILESGAESSQIASSLNSELKGQNVRDQCDVINAKKVDNLEVGETLFGFSMVPAQELKNFTETYTKLGYKEGLGYLQTYSKINENTVISGSYSVDCKDEQKLRAALAKFGINIPAEATNNEWLLHSTVVNSDEIDIGPIVSGIRAATQENKRHSVSQYVESNKDLLKNYFNTYYSPLALAVASGRNNEILKSFAGSVMSKNSTDLKANIRQQLIKISNSERFEDESARVLDSIIRYAVVEELRKGLVRQAEAPASSPVIERSYYRFMLAELVDMNNILAANVFAGVAAGRSYGGCPGNIEIGNKNELGEDGLASPQEAYGGKKEDGDCEFISKQCPLCHAKNVKTKVSKIHNTTKKRIKGSCGCSVVS